MTKVRETCPHCGGALSRWRIPDGTAWEDEHFLVCFNDECSYYREGWEWMLEQFGQHASYRYAKSPTTGQSTMIPVWSPTAARDRIESDSEGEDG